MIILYNWRLRQNLSHSVQKGVCWTACHSANEKQKKKRIYQQGMAHKQL